VKICPGASLRTEEDSFMARGGAQGRDLIKPSFRVPLDTNQQGPAGKSFLFGCCRAGTGEEASRPDLVSRRLGIKKLQKD